MIQPFLLLYLSIGLCVSADLDFPGCPGRDHCLAMFDNAAADFRLRNCECDSACLDFGDCCEDYPRDDAQQRKNNSNLTMACLGFDDGPDNIGVYMVVDCPAGAEPDLRAECEGKYDPVIVFPDGPSYLNEHCAVCNGHTLDSLIRWNLIVDCEGPALSSAYLKQNLKQTDDGGWEVEFESKTYVCDVGFNFSTITVRRSIQPIDVRLEVFTLSDFFDSAVARRALRLCRANLVSECPREWLDDRVREACSGGYAAVVYGLHRAYRNPHCALCNGEDLRTLVCDPSELQMGRRKNFYYADHPDIFGDRDVGRRVEVCTKGQKYDPVSRSCRNIVCAIPGYVKANDKCVKKSSLEK